MTLPTFNPPVKPSPGTRRKPEIKVLKADFGDGYTQPTADGMNNVRQIFSLKWETLLPAQADEIEMFFEGLRGVGSFYYTPSNSTRTYKVKCDDWSRTDDTVHSMEATFTQVFTLSS